MIVKKANSSEELEFKVNQTMNRISEIVEVNGLKLNLSKIQLVTVVFLFLRNVLSSMSGFVIRNHKSFRT